MAKKDEAEEKKPDVYFDVLTSLVSAPDQGHAILSKQYRFDHETGEQIPSELVLAVSKYIAKKTGGIKETIEKILPTLWGVEFYQPIIEGALALQTPELKQFVNSDGVLDREKVVAFLATEQEEGEKVGVEAYKLAGKIESAVSERKTEIENKIASFLKQYKEAAQKGYSELTKLEKDSPEYKALEARLGKMEANADSYLSNLRRSIEALQGSETKDGIGAMEARSIKSVGEDIIGSVVRAGKAKYALGETVTYADVLGLGRELKNIMKVSKNMLAEAKDKMTRYMDEVVSKADAVVANASKYKAPALAY